jgi:hypothetical protein
MAAVPKLQREAVVGLDLLGHRADIAHLDAILVAGSAALGVLRTHLGGAKRFEPVECFA